jgi:hypothetical protein
MRRRFTAFTLVTAVLLSACAGLPPITEGTVIAKKHEDERRWTSLMPIFTGKVMIMVPMSHFDDEDWILTIQEDCTPTEEQPECRQEAVYVSAVMFGDYDVGDRYVAVPPASSKDPYERQRTSRG